MWDDRLFSVTVAKVLRPGRAEHEDALEDWARRRKCSARLPIR